MNIATSELLCYSTILENMISGCLEIATQCSLAVQEGHCTAEEIEKIHNKAIASKEEADEKYADIQKELDSRMMKDLKMKFGIRKAQTIIVEFDTFVKNKNKQAMDQLKPDLDAIAEISKETIANLSVVTDDKL